MGPWLLLLIALVAPGAVRAVEPLVFSAVEASVVDEIAFRVLQEAYGQLGQPVVRQDYPAERALVLASGGHTDGAVVRMPGIEQEYPNLLRVPVAINHEEGVVFTRSVALTVRGWESLRPYRLGIRRGIKFIEKGTQGMQVTSGTSSEQLFWMLAHDRVELVVLPRLLGMPELARVQQQGIRVLEPAAGHVDLYHYLHRRHAALLPAVTAVLQRMAREGRIEAIRREYLAAPAQP